MNFHCPKQFLPALLILALSAMGMPATAGEEPEATGEQSAVSTENYLRWTTATEVDNFGYYVYRGESEDGPFERLNPDPIPGAGTSDEPTSYEYVDDDIDLYQTYWYYLESISMSGEKERFTPVFRKKAKLTRPSSDEEGSQEGQEDPDQR